MARCKTRCGCTPGFPGHYFGRSEQSSRRQHRKCILRGVCNLTRSKDKAFNRDKTELKQILSALLSTSIVGVALCDRRLRFRAVNDALASMNGLSAEAHLGHSLRDVLGGAAPRVEAAFRHVFATGSPLPNFELTAQLPNREG